MKRHIFVAAVWLAIPSSSYAQTRAAVAAAEGSSSIGASAAAISAGIHVPSSNAVLPSGALTLSLTPSPSPSPMLNAAPAAIISDVIAVKTAAAVQLQAVIPSIGVSPLTSSLAHPSRKVTPSVAVQSVQSVKSVQSNLPLTLSEKSVAVVRDEVAHWNARSPEEGSFLAPAFSPSPSALLHYPSAASAPDRTDVPAPRVTSPSRSHPRVSKALVYIGASLIVVALVPALLPASLSAWNAAFAWTGFAALAASRVWRSPVQAPDVPRGPPAPSSGLFSSFKTAWAAARDSAAAQTSFEARVGASSRSSVRDWLLGGFRTGLYWMGPALMLMLAGAAAAKAAVFAFGAEFLAFAAPSAAVTTAVGASLSGGYLPMALAVQAAGVALYFGVEALARKLGMGRAAGWLGGAAALALAAAVVLSMTQAPLIVAATLGLEAGVIWSAARSRSFLAPLALRAILTVFSLEAARLAAWLSLDTAGTLVGLPAVWGGVAVAALVALAWKLKAPGLRLAEIGAWWKADERGQRPKSPGRILSAGLVWGLVVYAVGDLTFWAVNALSPGHEPTPAILAKMLTSGVDLVLYNFVVVGLLEEYVFRRGLFKGMNDKLEQWGLKAGRAFWIAAVVSAVIFSGVHYVDWGAVLAKVGMGDPASSSGLGGSYAFSAAGFVARSVLGVLLAWMYKRSGLLLIPIVAHFWADSMEGLGLRWGFSAFLMLAAGALLASFFFRPKLSASKG